MPKPMTVEGRIENINISPRGDLEGLLVATGDGTVQVNFDKKVAPAVAQWPIGKKIRLAAVLEEDGFAIPFTSSQIPAPTSSARSSGSTTLATAR